MDKPNPDKPKKVLTIVLKVIIGANVFPSKSYPTASFVVREQNIYTIG